MRNAARARTRRAGAVTPTDAVYRADAPLHQAANAKSRGRDTSPVLGFAFSPPGAWGVNPEGWRPGHRRDPEQE